MATSTTVRFIRSGINDGNVEIEEKTELLAEGYHLELSAGVQGDEFNNNGKLIITYNKPRHRTFKA